MSGDQASPSDRDRRPGLAERLTDLIGGLEGVERVNLDRGVELRRRGQPFAEVGEESATYRLGRTVVRAALRTPDTAPSTRGADWITFRPAELDRYAIDRATAWLESAWRHALE